MGQAFFLRYLFFENTLFDLIVVYKKKPFCPFILLSPFVLLFSLTALCCWVVVQLLLFNEDFIFGFLFGS